MMLGFFILRGEAAMAEEKDNTEMVNEDVKHGDEVINEATTQDDTKVETTNESNLNVDELRKELEGAQARIKELNKENEKRRLEEKERKVKELEAQGKYKELLAEKTEEFEALRAENEKRDAYIKKADTMFRQQLESEIADWDDELKELIDKDADVLEQLSLVNRLRKVHDKLKKPTSVGNTSGPVPNGGLGQAERSKKYREEVLEHYRRNF